MILVTGAGGHLGANLVRRLLAEAEPVRVLLHTVRDEPAVAGLRVEQMIGDLRDPGLAAAAVSGCRHLYHCAGKVSTTFGNHDEIFTCNVLATRHLLRAALDQAERPQARILEGIRRRRFYRPADSGAPDSVALLREDRER